MRVAIIDADLIYRNKHRFPNLACMKISAYYKSLGADVSLKLDYNNLHLYDLISISKVFIDTELPYERSDKSKKTEQSVHDFYKNHPILRLPNVQYGGTGFYYDKAPPLPDCIEHMMPDYHLYDDWVSQQLAIGVNKKSLSYYTDYSIGFTTRGCIRKCDFCVNKNYSTCERHSSISEFLDNDRPYICLLDDNIFACKCWKSIFDELISTGKRFQYKQGLDERLLTDERCEYLFKKSKWVGDKIFAFDNIRDSDIIIKQLDRIRNWTDEVCKFYVFCGFNHDNPGCYDTEFYRSDILNLFKRIEILLSYGCLPYIMRYKDCYKSKYAKVYNTIARWCNQPRFIKKCSISEFADMDEAQSPTDALDLIRSEFPEIADKYFNLKWSYSYGTNGIDTEVHR